MTAPQTSKKTHGQIIFNIQPTVVKNWVDNLPMGSTGEASKQLYHAIRQVNKQENAFDQHLEFLETIAPTLALIYPRLSKYFSDVSLPIDTKTRNALHVTNSLLTEILLSYKTLIKNLFSKKPFGWKKPFALAVHRTLIYSSQVFYTQQLTYQPPSKGNWRDIFWCYQKADKLNLLNKSFSNYSNDKVKTSIQYEFKKLVLLSLLSANDLDYKNRQDVHKLMPLWIKNTEILQKEPDDKKTCFTLNLISDVPPYLIGTRNDRSKQKLDRHYFSTFKLQKLLSTYLKKIDDEGAIRLGNNILSKSTIQSLLASWFRSHLRKEVRKTGTGFVDIITGITAIHFVLYQQDQPTYNVVSTDLPEVVDFESTLTIEPIQHNLKKDTLGLDYFLGNSDQEEDIWDKVYENNINELIEKANWTDSGSHKVYNFTKSILLDYSKDGYRLSINDKKVDSLKQNELVAVREHALAPWALAQVKWLHFSQQGDVQFGLRILSHHVLPINIRYHANHTLSKPLPCLLGLDTKKLMLFVPTLPTNLKGKKLQLEHQKQHSHIRLKNRLLTTPAFDVYEIHEPGTSDNQTTRTIQSATVLPESQDKNQTVLADNIWDNF